MAKLETRGLCSRFRAPHDVCFLLERKQKLHVHRIARSQFATKKRQSDMISKEFIKSNLRYLNGYLPVYKPSGISTSAIRDGVKLDGYCALSQSGIAFGTFYVDAMRYLEPFADGLLTLRIGQSFKKRKNFMFANYIYRGTMEFGVKREFDCIDGKKLATSNCDHLSAIMIQQTFEQFLGIHQQKRAVSYSIVGTCEGAPETASDYYNSIQVLDYEEKKKLQPPQKYRYSHPDRNMEIRYFKLLDYCKPFAEFELSCNGSFTVRQMCQSVAHNLNTDASLIKLTRLAEGPLKLEDLRLLHLHELNLDYYIHRMPALAQDYNNFNTNMDLLLEDVST